MFHKNANCYAGHLPHDIHHHHQHVAHYLNYSESNFYRWWWWEDDLSVCLSTTPRITLTQPWKGHGGALLQLKKCMRKKCKRSITREPHLNLRFNGTVYETIANVPRNNNYCNKIGNKWILNWSHIRWRIISIHSSTCAVVNWSETPLILHVPLCMVRML